MACVHNQEKINQLNDVIRTKNQQISDLKSNINKCDEIKKKHEKFNEKMNCVIDNLVDNYVVQGQPYDNGKMTECRDSSKTTISDCDDIISKSKNKIILLEREILNLERQIASLDCDCSLCQKPVVKLSEK